MITRPAFDSLPSDDDDRRLHHWQLASSLARRDAAEADSTSADRYVSRSGLKEHAYGPADAAIDRALHTVDLSTSSSASSCFATGFLLRMHELVDSLGE
jgi:hypothetical protein